MKFSTPTPSFIEAPFPTKVAYSEWLLLPESEQSAALAEAAALYAPRPPQQLVEQESSVFAKVLKTQDLVELIVSSLVDARRRQIFRQLGPAPSLRFLECRTVADLTIGDVRQLLTEYAWLSRALPAASSST